MGIEIAISARPHDRKRVASPRAFDLHLFDGLLERFGIVERPDTYPREAAERVSVKCGNAGLETDRRNPIGLALFDLEGHQEALARRIVFRQRSHDLYVGVTMFQIEATNQIAIGFYPFRIVEVTAADEAQQVRFVRLDDILEPIGRKGGIANEFD